MNASRKSRMGLLSMIIVAAAVSGGSAQTAYGEEAPEGQFVRVMSCQPQFLRNIPVQARDLLVGVLEVYANVSDNGAPTKAIVSQTVRARNQGRASFIKFDQLGDLEFFQTPTNEMGVRAKGIHGTVELTVHESPNHHQSFDGKFIIEGSNQVIATLRCTNVIPNN